MSLSHFKNSHAAVNKWEVVNPAMFEVTILPPTLDGQQDDKTTQLLLEHVGLFLVLTVLTLLWVL